MKHVRNTHKDNDLRDLYGAMVDLVALMNRPQNDNVLLRDAGVRLDRALFPLLIGIERFGPIGVGELADRAGRDYTTVSRQVAKLIDAGLIEAQPCVRDRRINETIITEKGSKMSAAIHKARVKKADRVFAKWNERDFRRLVSLMRRFVNDLVEAADNQTGGK